MKKLLVTVVGAVAALGAFAALNPDTVLQFENLSEGVITTNGLNTALGNYFSHGEGASNNTYTVNAANIGTCTVPSQIGENPTTKALDIKTTFGNPLDVSVVAGGTAQDIDTGIYFDSLVKFTVCEDAPTQTYDGAKIVMWLQSEDGTGPTNLMVKAGSLSYNLGVQVTAATYECALPADFDADAFHRVTIKSIKNITTSTTDDVPGFAIYIDQATVGTSTAKWDTTFSAVYGLTEAASYLNTQYGDLFPSLVQSGSATQLTKAGFDGTGSITDIVFTDDAPAFAADYVAPQASVVIGTEPVPGVTTLAGAVAAANGASAGNVVITLLKGMELEGPLAFSSAANVNVTLDFAGFVLTNNAETAAAISVTGGALTITNSSVNVGGVYCANSTAPAVYQGEDASKITIGAGSFWGNVTTDSLDDKAIAILGGSFKQNASVIGGWIAAGKTMVANAETGLNDVVDIVTYKVIYVYGLNGEYATTNDELEVGATTPAAPAEAAIAGYALTWTPAIAATVTEDVTYTAQYAQYVAQIDTKNYTTFAAALAEAVDGDTITLLDNVTEPRFQIPVHKFYDQGLTIDLGGNTYTFKAENASNDAIYLLSTNKLTIANGTFAAESGSKFRDLVRDYDSDLTLTNVTIDATNFPAKDGTKLACLLCIEGGDVNVLGSTSIINVNAEAYAIKAGNHANAIYEMGTLTVNTTGNINGNILIAGGVYNEVAVGSGSTIKYYYGKNVHSSWEDGVSSENFAARSGALPTAAGTQDNVSGQLFKTVADALAAVDEFTLLADYAGAVTFKTTTKITANGHALTGTLTPPSKEYIIDMVEGVYQAVEAPVVPTVDPAGTGTIDCASATEAASVADAINAAKETYITKPSTVADATTYYSYVQAVADGTAVKVALTAAGEEAAQASANTDVAQLPVANAAAADAEASIDSVAGLYYSILSGTAPTAVTTEGTRVVGNGGKITLTLPKQTGAAGFYKVKVSATAQ